MSCQSLDVRLVDMAAKLRVAELGEALEGTLGKHCFVEGSWPDLAALEALEAQEARCDEPHGQVQEIA